VPYCILPLCFVRYLFCFSHTFFCDDCFSHAYAADLNQLFRSSTNRWFQGWLISIHNLFLNCKLIAATMRALSLHIQRSSFFFHAAFSSDGTPFARAIINTWIIISVPDKTKTHHVREVHTLPLIPRPLIIYFVHFLIPIPPIIYSYSFCCLWWECLSGWSLNCIENWFCLQTSCSVAEAKVEKFPLPKKYTYCSVCICQGCTTRTWSWLAHKGTNRENKISPVTLE